MPFKIVHIQGRFLLCFLSLAVIVSACGGTYEETIGGVKIPVPKAMSKSSDKPAELAILGFGAGQAYYHGTLEEKKLIEFYKKEMPARGWQPSMRLVSGGAMLAYSKEGKSVLIGIGKERDRTILTLTVSGVGK